jgi:hypothetical protein
MAAVYLFAVIGVIPLIPACSVYRETVLLVSSCFLQLVALPLLAVGQSILNRSIEERARIHAAEVESRDTETHDAVMAALQDLKGLHDDATQQRAAAAKTREVMDSKLDTMLVLLNSYQTGR